MSNDFNFIDVDDLEKTITLLYLQQLYQDAVIREMAVKIDELIEHINYIEQESDFPAWDRQEMIEILKIHYANLHELKMQEAIYSGMPPVHISFQINKVELEIDELEQKLRHNE